MIIVVKIPIAIREPHATQILVAIEIQHFLGRQEIRIEIDRADFVLCQCSIAVAACIVGVGTRTVLCQRARHLHDRLGAFVILPLVFHLFHGRRELVAGSRVQHLDGTGGSVGIVLCVEIVAGIEGIDGIDGRTL